MKIERYEAAAVGTELGNERIGKVCWMHWLTKVVALIVPLHGRTDCGGRSRKSFTLER